LRHEASHARVLVVDDERFIANLMRDVLHRHGYAVDACHDGAAALALAEREHYHLVISDFAIPGMNGLELARRLGRSRPDIAMLIVSAYLDGDAVVALEAERNVVATVRKPFDIFDLVRQADSALGIEREVGGMPPPRSSAS
jgi:CheY-like chemotaxis protein